MMQLPAGKHRESMGQLRKSTTQVPPAHHKQLHWAGNGKAKGRFDF